MAKREDFEYVEVKEPRILDFDLKKSSDNFQASMGKASELAGLQADKHSAVDDAEELVRGLLVDLKKLDQLMMRGTMNELIEKGHFRKKMEAELKALEKQPEGELAPGANALKNLQRNLAELRAQLGA